MTRWTTMAARCYQGYGRRTASLQDVVLLVIRLYWGWSFAVAGWGKLMNVGSTATFFSGLGIPFPVFNAVLSGCVELGGGLLLLLGLAAKLAATVLLINMVAAYATAHTQEALALFSHPHDFVTAPPFLYLLASLIVLVFGPGLISLDALFTRYLKCCGWLSEPEEPRPPSVEQSLAGTKGALFTRRQAAGLSAAAVAGLIAGALLRDRIGWGEPPATSGDSRGPGKLSEGAPRGGETNGAAAIQALDAQAPEGIQPSLLLSERHVCRGLNTCKGKGKGGKNACAGQGTCATLPSHACNGLNDCKGQGGCGEYPGQNSCDGKGACAVPLKKETWSKARDAFQNLMRLKGQPLAQAPT